MQAHRITDCQPMVDPDAIDYCAIRLTLLRNVQAALRKLHEHRGDLPGHVYHDWETASLHVDDLLLTLECAGHTCHEPALYVSSLGKLCVDCATLVRRCVNCGTDSFDRECEDCTALAQQAGPYAVRREAR